MDKIAIGGGLPEGITDLDAEPAENLKALSKAKKVEIRDIVVCILDRPRHAELIAKVRAAGARIMPYSKAWPASRIRGCATIARLII